jgi:hypothetical protein
MRNMMEANSSSDTSETDTDCIYEIGSLPYRQLDTPSVISTPAQSRSSRTPRRSFPVLHSDETRADASEKHARVSAGKPKDVVLAERLRCEEERADKEGKADRVTREKTEERVEEQRDAKEEREDAEKRQETEKIVIVVEGKEGNEVKEVKEGDRDIPWKDTGPAGAGEGTALDRLEDGDDGKAKQAGVAEEDTCRGQTKVLRDPISLSVCLHLSLAYTHTHTHTHSLSLSLSRARARALCMYVCTMYACICIRLRLAKTKIDLHLSMHVCMHDNHVKLSLFHQ